MAVTEAKKLAGAVSLSGIISIGGLLTLLDNRYASAMDVQSLTDTIIESRIEELEFKIEDLEDRMLRKSFISEDELEPWEKQELIDLENKKERYIRRMERLTSED